MLCILAWPWHEGLKATLQAPRVHSVSSRIQRSTNTELGQHDPGRMTKLNNWLASSLFQWQNRFVSSDRLQSHFEPILCIVLIIAKFKVNGFLKPPDDRLESLSHNIKIDEITFWYDWTMMFKTWSVSQLWSIRGLLYNCKDWENHARLQGQARLPKQLSRFSNFSLSW